MLLNGGLAAGASRILFGGTYLNTADQTVYTFSDVDIGDAEPSRIVLVAAYVESTIAPSDEPFLSSVTIGGVDCTWITYHTQTGETGYSQEIWGAVVPEGVEADVVVEAGGECTFCEIACFSLYNQRWWLDENGDSIDPAFEAHEYPYEIDATTGAIRLLEGGVFVFWGKGVRTYTGAGTNFAGTYISGTYLLSPDAEGERQFTMSSAPEDFDYSGVAFGP